MFIIIKYKFHFNTNIIIKLIPIFISYEKKTNVNEWMNNNKNKVKERKSKKRWAK